MLNDEQIEEVRTFFDSQAGQAIFSLLQASYVADWMSSNETDAREECWRMYQAVERVKNLLRDAPAMKRLTQRAQERRTVQG